MLKLGLDATVVFVLVTKISYLMMRLFHNLILFPS